MSQTSYRSPEPGDFAFSAENEALAERIIARYPEGRHRSAVIPLLDIAQRQNGGWLSVPAIEFVAKRLGMAPIRVHEVASFYTMFNKQEVGRYLLQVCRTTPCWLRGSDGLTDAIREFCGIEKGETSADGLFTLVEVECLGACCNAPMVQINDDYYEDLTAESLTKLLEELKEGHEVHRGSQVGRIASARIGGPHTLTELPEGPLPEGILRSDQTAEEEAGDKPSEAAAATAPKEEKQAAQHRAAQGSADSGKPSGATNGGAPEQEAAKAKESHAEAAAEQSQEQKADAVGSRPPGLAAPREGKADDLTRIKGIGPKNQEALNELGVYHLDQIAAWSEAEAAWVGTYLAFPGRIEREDWVSQAKALAEGA